MKKLSIFFAIVFVGLFLMPLAEGQEDRLYIDSVPVGARVYQYTEDNVDLSNPIGVTPMALRASEYPDKSFLVLMDINYYVETVQSISEMADWIAELDDNILGESTFDYHGFTFVTSQIVKLTSRDRKRMVAIGPVVTMQWPIQKRICIPFIPNTASYSSFYSLMPPRGTFSLPSSVDWINNLISYELSPEKIGEAINSLSRCGCYIFGHHNIILNDKTSREMLSLSVPDSAF